MVTFKDPTNAERAIDIELATQPEYRRLRTLAKQAAKLNRPPFVVIKDNQRETLATWRELLAHVKSEGMREVTIQRYKGLGEMNAEQLWETTMNAETRTLLKVRLEDLVADRRNLHHADGRGRGEPAQVHRRERAGRAESGRIILRLSPDMLF